MCENLENMTIAELNALIETAEVLIDSKKSDECYMIYEKIEKLIGDLISIGGDIFFDFDGMPYSLRDKTAAMGFSNRTIYFEEV